MKEAEKKINPMEGLNKTVFRLMDRNKINLDTNNEEEKL